jgi:hypothetical protein
MIPKEKAIELFDKMFLIIENKGMYDDLYRAKQCALIAVDEVLDAIVIINEHNFERLNKYWAEVKQEIEAL